MDIKRLITAILLLAVLGLVFIYAGRLGNSLASKAGV